MAFWGSATGSDLSSACSTESLAGESSGASKLSDSSKLSWASGATSWSVSASPTSSPRGLYSCGSSETGCGYSVLGIALTLSSSSDTLSKPGAVS